MENQGIYITPAMQELGRVAQELFDQCIDDALVIGLNEYKRELLETMSLAECKKHLRISDMGDGDKLIDWEPTGQCIMFMQSPVVTVGENGAPKVSVGYRVPTIDERLDMVKMGR